MTKDGFTLLELLVTLSIMALIATLTLPFVVSRDSGGASQRAAVSNIVWTLRMARSEAVRRNAETRAEFDLAARTVGLAGIAPRSLPGDLKLRLDTSADAVAGGQRGWISFYPDGSSSGGGVTVAGQGGTSFVAIDWLTGRVQVRE